MKKITNEAFSTRRQEDKSKIYNELATELKIIRGWALNQDLVKRALDSCKVALHNCAKEEKELGLAPLGGYELEKIQMQFDKQSLVFEHDVLAYPYIDTQIGLYLRDESGVYFRDIEPIGAYSLITTLDGKDIDDYLMIDDKRFKKK